MTKDEEIKLLKLTIKALIERHVHMSRKTCMTDPPEWTTEVMHKAWEKYSGDLSKIILLEHETEYVEGEYYYKGTSQ